MNSQQGSIKLAFLDVGQGDTIVISHPSTEEAIVVDCIDAEAVIDYLEQEKTKYLRGIIVTHLHQDHYMEVDYLLSESAFVPDMQACEKLGFRIVSKKHFEQLITDNDDHQSLSPEKIRKGKESTLQKMMAWCRQDRTRHFEPCVQNIIQEGSPGGIAPTLLSLYMAGTLAKHIQVLHPSALDLYSLEAKGLNNTSVVLRVLGPGSSALLMGDLEPPGWHVLRTHHPDVRSDVLKFHHHGGAWDEANTRELLDTVQPSFVIISVGTGGERYNHPDSEVFNVLSSPSYQHIRVLCTQATNQCQPVVLAQRQSVIDLLDTLANELGRKRIGSKQGCPCAGTILVELGKKALILQPTAIFHQEKIISPYFQTHQCGLAV